MNDKVGTDPYQAPDAALDVDAAEDALLRRAIGENNTDYYLGQFKEAAGQSWKLSWNWPAFFVTWLWMLYRKMWAAWLVYAFGLPLLVALPGIALMAGGANESSVAMIDLVINGIYLLVIFVGYPLIANALYQRKVNALIGRAQAAGAGRDEQLAWLDKHGGTSWVWIVVLLGGVMLIGILAAVALPAYQDYIQNAEMARQLQQDQ